MRYRISVSFAAQKLPGMEVKGVTRGENPHVEQNDVPALVSEWISTLNAAGATLETLSIVPDSKPRRGRKAKATK